MMAARSVIMFAPGHKCAGLHVSAGRGAEGPVVSLLRRWRGALFPLLLAGACGRTTADLDNHDAWVRAPDSGAPDGAVTDGAVTDGAVTDGAVTDGAVTDARGPHPLCGNGQVDPGEVCDDGNNVDGDGCSADCLSDETCGNAILDPGEACDLGVYNSDAPNAACRTNCAWAACGDGITDLVRGEACDQGPENSDVPNASCRTDCQLRRCGDGIVDHEAGEVCDDGGNLDGDGCSANCLSDETCGNGLVDRVVGERCDDGNDVPSDGCHGCLPSETQVNLEAARHYYVHCVAAAPDGSMAVVWSGEGTMAQRFAGDGSRAGAPYALSGAVGVLDCSLTASGELHVLERSSGLWLRCYGPEGAALGDPCRVTDLEHYTPYVAAMTPGAQGSLVVAWTRGETSVQLHGIRARILSTEGDFLSEERLVAEDGGSYVSVGADSGGRFLVSWGDRMEGVDHIYALWHGPDGAPEAPAFLLYMAPGPYPAFRARSALLSVAPDGRAVAAWTLWQETPRWRAVLAQRFDASGHPIGPPGQVSAYPFFDQWLGGLAIANDGGFAVTWQGDGLDGDDHGVQYSLVDPQGSPLTIAQGLGSITAGRQWTTRVASLAGGGYLFAWTSRNEDEDSTVVYALRLDDNGEAMYLEPGGAP